MALVFDLVLFAKDDVMMQNKIDYVLFRLTQCRLTSQNSLH